MATRKKIFLIIVLIITGGLCYAYYIWNKPARDVTNEKAIKITAAAIFDSFANNEQSANAHFLNKAIEVTGTVTECEEEPGRANSCVPSIC